SRKAGGASPLPWVGQSLILMSDAGEAQEAHWLLENSLGDEHVVARFRPMKGEKFGVVFLQARQIFVRDMLDKAKAVARKNPGPHGAIRAAHETSVAFLTNLELIYKRLSNGDNFIFFLHDTQGNRMSLAEAKKNLASNPRAILGLSRPFADEP